MPTYDYDPLFDREDRRLTLQQQALFRAARDLFVADLKAHRTYPYNPVLRIKGVKGRKGIFEMTWDADGRPTFTFGDERVPGETHIHWRRIGDHDILKQP